MSTAPEALIKDIWDYVFGYLDGDGSPEGAAPPFPWIGTDFAGELAQAAADAVRVALEANGAGPYADLKARYPDDPARSERHAYYEAAGRLAKQAAAGTLEVVA